MNSALALVGESEARNANVRPSERVIACYVSFSTLHASHAGTRLHAKIPPSLDLDGLSLSFGDMYHHSFGSFYNHDFTAAHQSHGQRENDTALAVDRKQIRSTHFVFRGRPQSLSRY